MDLLAHFTFLGDTFQYWMPIVVGGRCCTCFGSEDSGCSTSYVHITRQAGWLFGSDQKEGKTSEPVEVGDLSRGTIKRGGDFLRIFSDRTGSQKGWKGRAHQTIQKTLHLGMSNTDLATNLSEFVDTSWRLRNENSSALEA
jgi:hypothetical protein